MTHDPPAAWRRRMSEAAALPADDGLRLEVQAEVSRLGAWAEAEWLALLEEGERWRIELARVDVPADLGARLLRIPADLGARGRVARVRSAAWAIGAAAVVALAVLVSRGGLPRGRDETAAPVAAFADLAAADHRGTHTLEVESGRGDDVRAGLRARIPFEIRVPALTGGVVLEGGRRCTLGRHPVCFTSWRRGDARLTLVQGRRLDLGLPSGMAPARVDPAGPDGARASVLVWSDAEFGYALVASAPAALDGVEPAGR